MLASGRTPKPGWEISTSVAEDLWQDDAVAQGSTTMRSAHDVYSCEFLGREVSYRAEGPQQLLPAPPPVLQAALSLQRCPEPGLKIMRSHPRRSSSGAAGLQLLCCAGLLGNRWQMWQMFPSAAPAHCLLQPMAASACMHAGVPLGQSASMHRRHHARREARCGGFPDLQTT